MTHKRKQIKAKIREILIEALDGIIPESEIKIEAIAPVQDSKLPTVRIYIKSENIDLHTTSPRTVNRDSELIIEIYASGNTGEDLDDFLDDSSYMVEKFLGYGKNENLEGLVDNMILAKTEMDADYTGRYPMGAVRMSYLVQSVIETDTFMITDDLKTLTAKWKISNAEYSGDAENPTDTINLT